MNWDSIEVKWTEMARRVAGESQKLASAVAQADDRGSGTTDGGGVVADALSGALAALGKPELASV